MSVFEGSVNYGCFWNLPSSVVCGSLCMFLVSHPILVACGASNCGM